MGKMTAAQFQNGHHRGFLLSEQLHIDRRAITRWVLPGTGLGARMATWVFLLLSYSPSWTKPEKRRGQQRKAGDQEQWVWSEREKRICLWELAVTAPLAGASFFASLLHICGHRPQRLLATNSPWGSHGRQPLRGRLGALPGPLASRPCGDVGERWKCQGNGKEERKSRIKDRKGKFILLYHPTARKKTLVLPRLMSVQCWLERPGQGSSLPQVRGWTVPMEKRFFFVLNWNWPARTCI